MRRLFPFVNATFWLMSLLGAFATNSPTSPDGQDIPEITSSSSLTSLPSSEAAPEPPKVEYLTYKDCYGQEIKAPIIKSFQGFSQETPREGNHFAFTSFKYPPSTNFLLELAYAGARTFKEHGQEVPVGARVFLPPQPKEEKYPLLICAADSFGVRDDDLRLARLWAEKGIASIWIDSDNSLGNTDLPKNQLKTSLIRKVHELYLALALAETHPKLDTKRALTYGSSLGGIVSQLAAFSQLRFNFGSKVAFEGFVSVSGLPLVQLSDTALSNGGMTGKPLYFYHGSQDHWADVNAQSFYFQRLTRFGLPAYMRLYPGGHCFERNVEPAIYTDVQNYTSKCMVLHDGLEAYADLGRAMAYDQGHSTSESPSKTHEKVLQEMEGFTAVGSAPYASDIKGERKPLTQFADHARNIPRGGRVHPNVQARKQFEEDLLNQLNARFKELELQKSFQG